MYSDELTDKYTHSATIAERKGMVAILALAWTMKQKRASNNVQKLKCAEPAGSLEDP